MYHNDADFSFFLLYSIPAYSRAMAGGMEQRRGIGGKKKEGDVTRPCLTPWSDQKAKEVDGQGSSC